MSKQFRALVDSINTKILSPKEKGLPQVSEEAPFRLLRDVTPIKAGIGLVAQNVALSVRPEGNKSLTGMGARCPGRLQKCTPLHSPVMKQGSWRYISVPPHITALYDGLNVPACRAERLAELFYVGVDGSVVAYEILSPDGVQDLVPGQDMFLVLDEI